MCKTTIVKKTRNFLLGGAVAALGSLGMSVNANGALNAYEDFDYNAGENLTLTTNDNGTGWLGTWDTTGVPGLTNSGSGLSLYFGQANSGLYNDGSTHVWSESSKGNTRDLATPVALGPDTLYYTSLIRSYSGGANTIDMRVQLHDAQSAAGNVRGVFGVSNGTLFANAGSGSYNSGTTLANAFAQDTTYLLAMKRTDTHIYASLIEADGNAATLANEPTWQVSHALATGITVKSIRFLTNGSGQAAGGARHDEIRLATDWDSAVAGIVVPEPATMALLGLGGIAAIRRRRKA